MPRNPRPQNEFLSPSDGARAGEGRPSDPAAIAASSCEQVVKVASAMDRKSVRAAGATFTSAMTATLGAVRFQFCEDLFARQSLAAIQFGNAFEQLFLQFRFRGTHEARGAGFFSPFFIRVDPRDPRPKFRLLALPAYGSWRTI
jgi:hypothetical protein